MFRLLSRILWMRTEKPLVAMTMGDPAGIGPEVIAAVWQDERVHASCRPLVVGSPLVFERACKLFAPTVRVATIESPEEALPAPHAMPCIPACQASAADVPPGVIDARGGQAAYDALVAAARLALANRIDAIVTAPLSKAALWQAGHHYPGHTELLAELCGVDDFAMMLYLAPDVQVRRTERLGRHPYDVAHLAAGRDRGARARRGVGKDRACAQLNAPPYRRSAADWRLCPESACRRGGTFRR